MHLLIPFASSRSAEVRQRLPTLDLPNLARLLERFGPTARDDGDEYSLSPPHERALAAAWGWHGGDGLLPFAAHAAAADGIEVGDAAWALVTPAHWHVGREHISMADPAALDLGADESRALFAAVRELFVDDGYRFEWGAAERWYASHPAFAALACASIDRVVGRNVDFWLDGGVAREPHALAVRRLQSEVQLLLYPHPINDAREERGALAVNSFWLSGCGIRQRIEPPGDVAVDASLRTPVLDGDTDGWAAAWHALDAGPLAALLRTAATDRPTTMLTLCGERSSQRLEPAQAAWWQRLLPNARKVAPHALLESL